LKDRLPSLAVTFFASAVVAIIILLVTQNPL